MTSPAAERRKHPRFLAAGKIAGHLIDRDMPVRVRDIGLGFRPFLSAGTDPERFHFLYSAATASRLSVELPALRFGFHGPTSCLHHHPARRVELRFETPEPWSVDADLYPPASVLRLSAWAPIRFVSY